MTTDDALWLLAGDDVVALLDGEEAAVMQTVQGAYATHAAGSALAPHSTFVRLPGGRDRMIALPAYLGGAFDVAGVKWIASFPGNHARGLERASGVVVLSSTTTGRATAVLEGSVISAKRTAASAAVAARALHATPPAEVGLVGCGVVNLETLRFLRQVWPTIATAVVCDLSPARAERFAVRCGVTFDRLRVEIVPHARAVLERVPLLSIATTAMQPHLDDLGGGPLRTVLHLSLRDLAPAIVLAADNVVDDADHVCRAETSLHRAEHTVGHRGFIRCALADILAGREPPKRDYDAPTIFSPFGLGILDIAVAKLVWERAIVRQRGFRLPFAPTVAA